MRWLWNFCRSNSLFEADFCSCIFASLSHIHLAIVQSSRQSSTWESSIDDDTKHIALALSFTHFFGSFDSTFCSITLSPVTTSCIEFAISTVFIRNFHAWKFEPSNFFKFRRVSSDIFVRVFFLSRARAISVHEWRCSEARRRRFEITFQTLFRVYLPFQKTYAGWVPGPMLRWESFEGTGLRIKYRTDRLTWVKVILVCLLFDQTYD